MLTAGGLEVNYLETDAGHWLPPEAVAPARELVAAVGAGAWPNARRRRPLRAEVRTRLACVMPALRLVEGKAPVSDPGELSLDVPVEADRPAEERPSTPTRARSPPLPRASRPRSPA